MDEKARVFGVGGVVLGGEAGDWRLAVSEWMSPQQNLVWVRYDVALGRKIQISTSAFFSCGVRLSGKKVATGEE